MKTCEEFTASVLEKAEAERKRRSANRRRLIVAVPGAAAAVAAVVFAAVVFRGSVSNHRAIAVDTTAPSSALIQSVAAHSSVGAAKDNTSSSPVPNTSEISTAKNISATSNTEKTAAATSGVKPSTPESTTRPAEPTAVPYEAETTTIPSEEPAVSTAPVISAIIEHPTSGNHTAPETTTAISPTKASDPAYSYPPETTTLGPVWDQKDAEGTPPPGAENTEAVTTPDVTDDSCPEMEQPSLADDYMDIVLHGVSVFDGAIWQSTDTGLRFAIVSEREASEFGNYRIPLTYVGGNAGYFFRTSANENVRYFIPVSSHRTDGQRIVFSGTGSAQEFLRKVNEYITKEKEN